MFRGVCVCLWIKSYIIPIFVCWLISDQYWIGQLWLVTSSPWLFWSSSWLRKVGLVRKKRPEVWSLVHQNTCCVLGTVGSSSSSSQMSSWAGEALMKKNLLALYAPNMVSLPLEACHVFLFLFPCVMCLLRRNARCLKSTVASNTLT